MRRVFRSPSPAPRSSVCHSRPVLLSASAVHKILCWRFERTSRAEPSPSLRPLLYVLVLPTSGEFMLRLPQLKNLIIIRRGAAAAFHGQARGIISRPFRNHFSERRLAWRGTDETFNPRRLRGTREGGRGAFCHGRNGSRRNHRQLMSTLGT